MQKGVVIFSPIGWCPPDQAGARHLRGDQHGPGRYAGIQHARSGQLLRQIVLREVFMTDGEVAGGKFALVSVKHTKANCDDTHRRLVRHQSVMT